MRHLVTALLCAASTVVFAGVAQEGTTYIPTTVAGAGFEAYSGDGRAATLVDLFYPEKVAIDHSGSIYFTEAYYGRVLKIAPDGTLSTVAGGGTVRWTGNTPTAAATSLQFDDTEGLALDSTGNLYFGADNRLWKLTSDGAARPIGGTGQNNSTVGDGTAISASFATPWCVAADSAGNAYFCDAGHNMIRRISPDGKISTVAGTGVAGYSGDGQAANTALLNGPEDIVLDGAGNLYIADTFNYRIRKVAANGIITTIAGTGKLGNGVGVGVIALSADLYPIYSLALDASGNFYFSGSRYAEIHRLEPSGLIYMESTYVQACNGMAPLPTGGLVALDFLRHTVSRISGTDGHTTLLAGTTRSTGIGDGRQGTQAVFLYPYGLALNAAGDLWIADADDQRIRHLDAAGIITTVAGTGIFGATGDNGPATGAQIAQPHALAIDSSGAVYFNNACQVRRIRADGIVETVVGSGTCGFFEPLSAAAAMLTFPKGLAVDSTNNLYISDTGNHRIRKVTPGGMIRTIAGSGVQGYSGNNGSNPLAAAMDTPTGVAVDSKGNVYFSDSGNHRVRKITSSGIYDFAGNGSLVNDGDGGPALSAGLCVPQGLAVDAADYLYVASCGLIRRVGPDGLIITIGGSGNFNYIGDGDLATIAGMDPNYLVVDSQGRVYFSDGSNRRVRRLDPAQIFPAGVMSDATFLAGPVAPGEIVAIYASGLGPVQPAVASLDPSGPPLATKLAGLEITFDGVAAPLLYVSETQAAAVVPFAVASRQSTVMQAIYNNQTSNSISLRVAAASPGLFTTASNGKGQASILNQDYTLNSAGNRAAPGDIVMLYGTGAGQTSPASSDGHWATAMDALAAGVSVTIGGVDAPVTYSGSAPGMVAGFFQINVRVPDGAPSGAAVPVIVTVGGTSSPASATMAIR
jgi:uncharacterized protein (TIGR03437 family)